jgi:hypothetical protein
MIAVTRIPTHRNDGSKVSTAERQRILKRVREKFRGYSLEGPFPGAWVAASGEVFEEASYKLEVVISRKEVGKARAHFMEIGRQLGQRAIYFELREGGEIIDLE